VAAYEHMPGHRRNHIFSSFVDKLGPDDFLFAVLAMLVDKYGSNKDVADFAAGLASRYNAITQLGV
jgi:U3 small nucleolar RNA-associated protein 10